MAKQKGYSMQIKQGADKTFAFYVYNQSGEVVKDEPSDIVFTAENELPCGAVKTIKKSLGNGIALDGETGKYTLTFVPADTINLPTGAYPFDIKIKRAGKQYFVVKQGFLKIVKSYTGVI